MDCSPPSSSVHGISPARILEWVAIIFSRGSSRSRDQTYISCAGRWIPYHWGTGKPTWYLLNMSKEHKCPWACYLRNISIYFFPQVKEKLEHFLLQDFPLTWNLGPKLCFHFFLNDVGVLLLFFSVLLLLAWFCNYLGISSWRRLLRLPWTARRPNQSILKEISPGCSLEGLTLNSPETPILWPPDVRSWLVWKDPDVGKDWRQEETGTIEDEMVRWHHRLNRLEFE